MRGHCCEKVDEGYTRALSDSNIDLNDQSNWNCEILSHDERGEPKCLMKNLSQQGRQSASDFQTITWVQPSPLLWGRGSCTQAIQTWPGCTTKLLLSPSAKQCWNPCSTPPPVYQDLSACRDWPVKKAIVNLPIRLKGNSKLISGSSLSPLGARTRISALSCRHYWPRFNYVSDAG